MSTTHDAYQRKLLTPRAAADLLRVDDHLVIPILTGQPAAFLAALGERSDWRGLTIFGGLLTEPHPVLQHPGVRYISGFYGPIERMMIAAGANIDYLPADFLGYERYARQVKPRAVAAAVSPMDERGYLSFGLHAGAAFESFVAAARDPARLAVAEVIADMPHVYGLGQFGGHRVHISEIDALVESDRSAMVVPDAAPSDADRQIGAYVESLVPDGATLQFGIGAIPNIVAQMLADGAKGDFGIHSEMFIEGIMRLHRAGKVTNHKGIFDGFSIATFGAGSTELYRWLHRNPEVRMLPVMQVNDPSIIRQNRRMVSINGAIGVDLTGQVMADSIGPRQYSGVGGHELFVIGAHDAVEGRSIICLRSTTTVDGKTVSNIVDALPLGTPTSTPRHHVQYVVTEHGVANLGMLTARERRAALAAVAHPDFRAELG